MITQLILFATTSFWAQAPDRAQVKDTLRFIRLAETRKQLSFNEEKLLKVNEILDEIEDRRIDLGQRERQLKKQVARPGLTEQKAVELLQSFRQMKQEQAELDLLLFDRIQAVLNPLETIEFFGFYADFKRQLAKRVNMLRQRERPPKRRR